MLLQKKIIIRIAKYAVLIAVTVSLLFIFFSGSEDVYIDIYSGRLKTIRKEFLLKRSHISDTDFSKLVEKYKLVRRQEEWIIATSNRWGIGGKEWGYCIYGTAVEACREFTLVCEMGYVPQTLCLITSSNCFNACRRDVPETCTKFCHLVVIP